jgi:hypothetical protein
VNLKRGLKSFEAFFCNKLILRGNGDKNSHFLSASAGFSQVIPSMTEKGTRAGLFPIIAGSLSESSRQKHGSPYCNTQISGIFPVSLESIFTMGRDGSKKEKTLVADILNSLASGGKEVKEFLVDAKVIEYMVNMANSKESGVAQRTSLAEALKALSSGEIQFKQALLNTDGALTLLGKFVKHGTDDQRQDSIAALESLSKISCAAQKMLVVSGAIIYPSPTPYPDKTETVGASVDSIMHAMACHEPQSAIHNTMLAHALFVALDCRSDLSVCQPTTGHEKSSEKSENINHAKLENDLGNTLATDEFSRCSEAALLLLEIVRDILYNSSFKEQVRARKRFYADGEYDTIKQMMDLELDIGSETNAHMLLGQYAVLAAQLPASYAFPYQSLFIFDKTFFMQFLDRIQRIVSLLWPILGTERVTNFASVCHKEKVSLVVPDSRSQDSI